MQKKDFKIIFLSILVIFIFVICYKFAFSKNIDNTNTTKNCVLEKEYWCFGDKKCRQIYKYKFDNNGNKTQYYIAQKRNFIQRAFAGSDHYRKTIYDSKENILAEYKDCNSFWLNCHYIKKYEYNNKGNEVSVSAKGCNLNNDCKSYPTNRYIYDDNNNMIASFENCDENFNNCKFVSKMDYNYDKNIITEYKYCDNNLQNCKMYDKKFNYNYEKKGNIKFRRDAKGRIVEKYTYDEHNNLIEKYKYQQDKRYEDTIKYKYKCN